jgi:hypothetical protein
MRLDKSRQYGMGGPSPCTLADIAALADLMELTGDSQRCSFLDRMQLMDGVYLTEHYRTKAVKPKAK